MEKASEGSFTQLCENIKILWQLSVAERDKEQFNPNNDKNNAFSGWEHFTLNKEVDDIIEHIIVNIAQYFDGTTTTANERIAMFLDTLQPDTLMRFALFDAANPYQKQQYQFLPDIKTIARKKMAKLSPGREQYMWWHKVLCCLAWNRNTPLGVLETFLETNIHWELASTTRDTIKVIADETTNPDQLRRLANIKVKGVRKIVAGNPCTPKEILEEYATNVKVGREIRKTVAKNPNLTKEAILFLEKEYGDDTSIVCNLMLNRATPYIVLQKVVDQPTSYDPQIVGLAVQSLYKRTDATTNLTKLMKALQTQ